MTRIYENRPLSRRMLLSTLVVAGAFLFGIWELYSAFESPEDSGYGPLFGIFFVGGSFYGMWQLHSLYGDSVVSLDSAGDAAAIKVWSPFVSRRIEGRLDQLTKWRFEAKQVGNARIPLILADHPAHPRPLRFEVGPGIAISHGFRTLTPDAIASFESAGRTT